MSKDPKIYLEHILECINLIEEYIKGKTKKDFFNTIQIQDAVIRRIEIIGEAVRNLPDDFKTKNIEVPWKKISGMRDILIHKYFGVDLELTWEVVKRDLNDLKKKIIKIKEKMN